MFSILFLNLVLIVEIFSQADFSECSWRTDDLELVFSFVSGYVEDDNGASSENFGNLVSSTDVSLRSVDENDVPFYRTSSFSGEGEYIEILEDGMESNAFSVSLWFRFTECIEEDQDLISKDEETWLMTLTKSSCQLRVQVEVSGEVFYYESVTSFQEDQWYHAVLTSDGSNSYSGIVLYVDDVVQDYTGEGSFVLQDTEELEEFESTIRIGGEEFPFSGDISCVHVYDVSLSTLEVEALSQGCNCFACPIGLGYNPSTNRCDFCDEELEYYIDYADMCVERCDVQPHLETYYVRGSVPETDIRALDIDEGGYQDHVWVSGEYGESDLFVSKYDIVDGNRVYTTIFGSSANTGQIDAFTQMLSREDGGESDIGGVVVAGNLLPSESDQGGGGSIIRIVANGEMTWKKIFEDGSTSGIAETSFGGYLVVGQVHGSEGYLLEIDEEGEKTDDCIFPNTESLVSVTETSDLGYVVGVMGGGTSSSCGGDNFGLVKYDADGGQEWARFYGGVDSELTSILELDDGYVITGRTKVEVNASSDKGFDEIAGFIGKISLDGNTVLWAKTYKGVDVITKCVEDFSREAPDVVEADWKPGGDSVEEMPQIDCVGLSTYKDFVEVGDVAIGAFKVNQVDGNLFYIKILKSMYTEGGITALHETNQRGTTFAVGGTYNLGNLEDDDSIFLASFSKNGMSCLETQMCRGVTSVEISDWNVEVFSDCEVHEECGLEEIVFRDYTELEQHYGVDEDVPSWTDEIICGGLGEENCWGNWTGVRCDIPPICFSGQYLDLLGTTVCEDCPSGTFSAEAGAIIECETCPEGQTSLEGAIECFPLEDLAIYEDQEAMDGPPVEGGSMGEPLGMVKKRRRRRRRRRRRM